MAVSTREFLGELRLGRELATPGQVAAGGLAIVLGLAVFLAGYFPFTNGTRVILTSLWGSMLIGLTLWSVLELLAGSSDRGGTYVLVYEVSGGLLAFITGWSVLAGGVTLCALLLKAAAYHLLWIYPRLTITPPGLAWGLLGVLILGQLLHLYPPQTLIWPVVGVLLTLLSVGWVFLLLRADPYPLVFPSPTSPPGVMPGVGLFVVFYMACEAILASRWQVRDPLRQLPPALLGTLGVSGLAFILIGWVTLRHAGDIVTRETALAHILARHFPPVAAGLVLSSALVLAANGCLMIAARQLHVLSRDGAFPRALRRVWRPFALPPLLFVTLAILTAPLTRWAIPETAIAVVACLMLIIMLVLNVTAIRSRHVEPERRRTWIVPFYPLVPALALVLNLLLLLRFPLPILVRTGGWLVIGMGIYLLYSRHHLQVAQEGVVVFGRARREVTEPGRFRILVPIAPAEERRRLLHLAVALARQLDGEVIPLQVIKMADPLAIEEGRRLAEERNILFQWSLGLGVDSGVPMYPITRLARSVVDGIVETALEEQCDLVLLAWTPTLERQRPRLGRVLDPVVRRLPCDVAVLSLHREEKRVPAGPERGLGVETEERWPVHSILVPTAGGPHAALALRIALWLAREHDAKITVLYIISPEASTDEEVEAQKRIQDTIASIREEEATLSPNGQKAPDQGVRIESRIITAARVAEGIVRAGAEHDLILMGASEESLIDQMLFGSLPEQVARTCPKPVLIVRRYLGLRHFWLKRAWDSLYAAFPSLTEEERVTVYKQIRRDARPDVDFFVMMGLATVIATLGLLQDSGAVIIGAMLVAPLFTPILGMSLAITHGDARLFRLALEATLKGVVLAVGLALTLTLMLGPWMFQLRPLSQNEAVSVSLGEVQREIRARIHPNLLDLLIALASGAAGAYAIARKDVATALPGVAIAAALVPPLSVVGIGLAWGKTTIAGGSALLFLTNLIAITLAGVIVLLLLGFHPAPRGERQARLRVGFITFVVLLVFIIILLMMSNNR